MRPHEISNHDDGGPSSADQSELAFTREQPTNDLSRLQQKERRTVLVTSEGVPGWYEVGRGRMTFRETLGDRYLYDLDLSLGRGSASEVLLGYDQLEGHSVAIKKSESPLIVEEYQLMKQVEKYVLLQQETDGDLEQVLPFPRPVDLLYTGGTYYLVMETAHGTPLNSYLKKFSGQGLPFDEVLDYGIQLCERLDFLHTLPQPVIFRDVWPPNIMIGGDGEVSLLDLGAAWLRTRVEREQRFDAIWQTGGRYMAPEVIARTFPLTPRTDIYSLGAVLRVLLVGEDPPGPQPLPNLEALRQRRPGLPQRMFRLLDRMCQEDALKRPENMLAVKFELQEIKFEHLSVTPRLLEARHRWEEVRSQTQKALNQWHNALDQWRKDLNQVGMFPADNDRTAPIRFNAAMSIEERNQEILRLLQKEQQLAHERQALLRKAERQYQEALLQLRAIRNELD